MGLGDHPETFLLKALCCQITPSWLKVMGGGWWWGPPGLYCHLLGLGIHSIPISHPQNQSKSQSQSLDNYSFMGFYCQTQSHGFVFRVWVLHYCWPGLDNSSIVSIQKEDILMFEVKVNSLTTVVYFGN